MATALVTADSTTHTGTGNTTSMTVNVGSGADRLLVVQAFCDSSPAAAISALSYAGNTTFTTISGSAYRYVTAYMKHASMASGSNTLTLTLDRDGYTRISWGVFTGVDQTTPINGHQYWDNFVSGATYTFPPANYVVNTGGAAMTSIWISDAPIIQHFGTFAGTQIDADTIKTGLIIDVFPTGYDAPYAAGWEISGVRPWYSRALTINAAAPAAVPHVEIVLANVSGTPITGLSALKWAWFDQATPNIFAAPTCQGTAETTDGSGILRIDITTTLSAGGIGWLDITDSTGSPATAHRVFGGPLAVIVS